MAAATWQQRNPGQNPSYDYQDELRKSGMTYGQPQRGMMVDYYNQQNNAVPYNQAEADWSSFSARNKQRANRTGEFLRKKF